MSPVEVPDRKQYRNNTQGWIGVVKLSHLGEELGENVDPGGTVWLTEQEAILTAQAPRLAEHNPFAERIYIVQDPTTKRRKEIKIRPLTLVSGETRQMAAGGRYVPGVSEAEEEARQAEATAEGAPAPEPPVIAVPPTTGSQVGDKEAPEPESWVAEPEAPGEVLQGRLSGDGGVTPDLSDPTLPKPGDGVRAQPQAQGQTVGAMLGAEEHAAAVDPNIGEETGAAKPKDEPPMEGEYAAHEEVGTPEVGTSDE